ncbi:hypothetical protein MXB_3959 [Myxobolus squamalis]|nr:hypothetical protein MXB_3959 [Myxobolus squamalis]
MTTTLNIEFNYICQNYFMRQEILITCHLILSPNVSLNLIKFSSTRWRNILSKISSQYNLLILRNFSFDYSSNVQCDERGFYFYINLLLQIYNVTSECEFIEKFQPNVEIFIHEQLNFLLSSIKLIFKKGANIKLVIVFVVFYLINFIVKKYKIVRAVIEKSSFIDELYRLQQTSASNPFDKSNLLHILLQIELLKISPFFFNHLHQMLIHPDDEEFQNTIKIMQSMSNKDSDLDFYVFLKIFQSIEISLNLGDKSLIRSLVNFAKESVPVSSSIHSSDYEIASCVVVTHEQRFCGFVTFNDSYIILAEPARKLIVALRFLTDDAMNIVFQKLCSRIKIFDSIYTKYLQKLGITATSIKEVSTISPTETMKSLYDTSYIYFKPSQASVLSNIINGGDPQ